MRTQVEFYRAFQRQYPDLPPAIAWRHAWHADRIDRWAVYVGLEHGTLVDPCDICWDERGYAIRARIEIDESGWDLFGTETIGCFKTDWESGAIEHDRFNNRPLNWFVPAVHGNAGALYRRACSCGDQWHYLTATVVARRAGVDLSAAVQVGIESDKADSDYLIRTVFALNCEAIDRAERKLRELCGLCH